MNIKILIESRKKLWNKFGSMEKDKDLTEAISSELHKDKNLAKEIKDNPFSVIELLFRVRDKQGKLMPFILNYPFNSF